MKSKKINFQDFGALIALLLLVVVIGILTFNKIIFFFIWLQMRFAFFQPIKEISPRIDLNCLFN